MQKVNLQWESFWRDSTLWICARADKFANANVCHEILATLAMTQRFAYCCVGCGR
ncbi:hypothetical protein [Helicobacter rodentium]|uniref:hypothetical protein n=1 Tax=Helicobacter rodentium TaxID=59617 RepID=UPI002353FE4F|nr:hypothetical protein [Helicobacter rodentium]